MELLSIHLLFPSAIAHGESCARASERKYFHYIHYIIFSEQWIVASRRVCFITFVNSMRNARLHETRGTYARHTHVVQMRAGRAYRFGVSAKKRASSVRDLTSALFKFKTLRDASGVMSLTHRPRLSGIVRHAETFARPDDRERDREIASRKFVSGALGSLSATCSPFSLPSLLIVTIDTISRRNTSHRRTASRPTINTDLMFKVSARLDRGSTAPTYK